MKDKGVKKNPATMGGRFHDSSSSYVKHLRSRQRRLVDEKLTFEGYLEHFNCELDIVAMDVSDAVLFYEDPASKSIDERIIELAIECEFEEDWMLEERLCGTVFQLVLVHNGKRIKGWHPTTKTGPADPAYDFSMGRE